MGCFGSKQKARIQHRDDESLPLPSISPNTKERISTFKVSHAQFINEKKSNIFEDYTFLTTIGKGAYGQVKKAIQKKTNITRAIKIIVKQNHDKEKLERIMNEVNILKQIDHPNIMKIVEFYQDKNKMYIVTEFYDGGELFEKILKDVYLDEKEAAKYMSQILSAVNYCHQRKIVHRDIKPENILLESKSPNAEIKMIDFGTSQYFEPNQKLQKAFGTAYYVAPEVLNKSYTEKCDIWSCGVILYILLCGRAPFNGSTEQKILQRVKAGKYNFDHEEFSQVSHEVKDLINKMLTFDYNKRPSAMDCLMHPWFKLMYEKPSTDLKPIAVNALKNLETFRAERKFQEAVYTFMATFFANKEEKEKLSHAFKELDIDNNGVLSYDEIKVAYEHAGQINSVQNLDEMIKNIDTDGNGEVDYTEFIAASLNRASILTQEKLETAFKLIDKDGNGNLSADELKELFGGDDMDNQLFKDLIKEADVDKDGQISLKEFKNMMIKMLNQNENNNM